MRDIERIERWLGESRERSVTISDEGGRWFAAVHGVRYDPVSPPGLGLQGVNTRIRVLLFKGHFPTLAEALAELARAVDPEESDTEPQTLDQ